MIKMSELKSWADDLKLVLFDINIAMSNLHILRHQNADKFRINYYDVYLNLWYQQNFILVVQLAKIFSESDNQKRNIKKLCNRYKNEKLDEAIKKLLIQNKEKTSNVYRTRQDILDSVDEILIEIETHKQSIIKINELRDKVFAHTDPKSSEHILEIQELTSLTILANKIYNSLFGKVFDEYEHFQITESHDFRSIIEIVNSNS